MALHAGVPVMVLTATGHAARRTSTLDVGRWLCWPAALALLAPCLGRKILYKVLKHTSPQFIPTALSQAQPVPRGKGEGRKTYGTADGNDDYERHAVQTPINYTHEKILWACVVSPLYYRAHSGSHQINQIFR